MASLKSDGMAIMIVFIGAIVAVTFMATIGDSIFKQTTIIMEVNRTIIAGEINVSVDITGREVVEVIEIYNASDESQSYLNAGVNVVTGISSTTQLLSVQLIVNDTGTAVVATPVNVTYTYRPDGYLSEAGARGINRTTLIMAALSIVVFVIVVFIANGSLGKMMRES